MNKRKEISALTFAPLLENYFLTYMITQKKASSQTIASYRDSFTIYIGFLSEKYGVRPDRIEMTHFSLDYLSAFGVFLENERKCASTTINLRMAAIKSFLKYASIEAPEYSGLIRKSLSLPSRKADKPVMTFLSKTEYEAMLIVCDNQHCALSARDKMMLMILYNTGCRVSELVNIRVSDVVLSTNGGTSYILFLGKGRKERSTPIWKSTASYIDSYIKLNALQGDNHLFKNARNGNLTRSGVSQRISRIAMIAADSCQSLKDKAVTPHTFRHSVAMNLLQSGVDISTIAIWLGHESIETTHKYMVADVEIKRKAMEKMDETTNDAYSYKPSKTILAFLKAL